MSAAEYVYHIILRVVFRYLIHIQKAGPGRVAFGLLLVLSPVFPAQILFIYPVSTFCFHQKRCAYPGCQVVHAQVKGQCVP